MLGPKLPSAFLHVRQDARSLRSDEHHNIARSAEVFSGCVVYRTCRIQLAIGLRQ